MKISQYVHKIRKEFFFFFSLAYALQFFFFRVFDAATRASEVCVRPES